MPLGAVVP